MLGLAALCFQPSAIAADGNRLVILHTNDTHSAIDPDAAGRGGILQRKAVFDSVRAAEPHVITVDAGDAVQGSLYFKYFKGDVEYPLMDMAGYDIRILGNHEFDNGMESLAGHYRNIKGERLSANYDFAGTALDGVFVPWAVKEAGGRKIGFFGININPESLISDKCIDVRFSDPIAVANETASMLRNEKGCDVVVAVTHIGYSSSSGKPSDTSLAASSRDIDIIIGGHSHTLVDPARPDVTPSLIPNADGRPVRVVQTGKSGQYVGKVTVDLDHPGAARTAGFAYELIPVTDRFAPETLDSAMTAYLKPYRAAVDSVMNRVVAVAATAMTNKAQGGGLPNLTADFGYEYGRHILDSLRQSDADVPQLDLAVMNTGGIRQSWEEGPVSEGQILSTYPFSNRFVIIKLKGSDLLEAMKVAARKRGEAVSGNVRVVTDGDWNLVRMIVDGREIDPEKYYTVGTIDYLAEGNDDLRTLARHDKIWADGREVSVPILEWIKRQTAMGLRLAPDMSPRFVQQVELP